MAFVLPPPPHDPSMPFRGGAKPVRKGKPVKGKPTDFGDMRSLLASAVPTSAGSAMGPHPPSPPAAGSDAALIQQMIAAMQLPQQQAIQNAQAASIVGARNSAASTEGYYKALAGILQSIGPATQAGYQEAAADDSAFGKGFANGLAQVQGKAGQQTDEALNVAGAPAAQGAQATAALGGTGATDALYGLGGYIPASTMNREGAAFGAAANLLPATAAGQGADAITQIGQQQRVDQQGFAKQFADLAAQVPGLSLQIGGQLASQHAAAQAERDRVAANDQHHQDVVNQQALSKYIADLNAGVAQDRAASSYASATGYTLDGKPTARTIAAQQNADANTSRAKTAAEKAHGFYVDKAGNIHPIAGWKLNADGTVTKDKTSKWVPGQSVVNSIGKMRVDGYTDEQVAGQLRKWHPNWTSAQMASALKAAPKLYSDLTKTQVAALRAAASSLRSEHVFRPSKTGATITIGGVTYKAGDTIPPIPFKQAVTFLIGRGYSRTDATAMLNHFYPRGQRK